MRRFWGRTAVTSLATLGVSLVFAAGAANAAVGDIVERAVPGTGAKGGLNRITTGPDGNVWFTNPGENQIGRLTPAGAFTGFAIPTANSSPIDITTGPDGALWFTEYGSSNPKGGKIGRITTSGQITEFPVAGRNAFGITKGSDGALWFVADCCDPSSPGMIGRITTAGAMTLYPVKAGTTPTVGITTGPDGNLWYPVLSSDMATGIQRMSTAGVVTGDFKIPTAYADPSRIVSGPDGNLWFTEQGSVGARGCCQPTFPAPGKIGRITPAGVITEFTTPGQAFPNNVSNPAGIALGPDGNLWFTEYSYFTRDTMVQHGGNKIGRITPSGAITEFPIPTPFARADGITGGPAGEGGVYFTESPNNFASGAIGRIQAAAPASGRVSVRLSAAVTPRRDRRAPYRFTVSGRVLLPTGTGVSACKGGRVSVQWKVAGKTISTRRVKLRPDCRYRSSVTFAVRSRLGSGRLKAQVRFPGNAGLKRAPTRTLSARAG